MKKTFLLIFGVLVAVASFGQTRVEKRNGIWYLIRTEVLTDTSQIPDPSKPPIVVIPPVDPNPGTFPGPVVNVLPGQSIKTAVERAAAGSWVTIQAGTYNEPNITVPLGVNIWGVGKVIINSTTAMKYGQSGTNGTEALISLASSARAQGNQRIHNLDLRGNGIGMGGLTVSQRNNVVVTQVLVDGFNFSGMWVMYADNIVVSGVRINNSSWISTGWASGEFNWVETNNCLFRDIITTSNSPNKGYGFKVLWSGKKNVYNNTFRKITTKMNHLSNWNSGQSYNIGFEMHDVRIQGNIVVDSSHFENQISLVTPEANPGTVTFQNSTHDGKNDRYTFETWLDNFVVRNFKSVNASQFSFNVESTRIVKNWTLDRVTYSRGTAPDLGWGATFLFGSQKASNIVIQASSFTPLTFKPDKTGIIQR
jgi:hypothetical protein